MGEQRKVSAEEIYSAALQVAFQVCLDNNGYAAAERILRDYAVMMDEITAYNNMRDDECQDWKRYITLLRSDSTINEIIARVKKSRQNTAAISETNK